MKNWTVEELYELYRYRGYTKKEAKRVAEKEYAEMHYIRINSVESRLYEYKKGVKLQSTESYIIHFANDLAVAMWRFQNIGTIYA